MPALAMLVFTLLLLFVTSFAVELGLCDVGQRRG